MKVSRIFYLIACVALIVGIMVDAIDFLPFMVMLLSLLALLSAVFMIVTYGTNVMMLSMVCLGALGLVTTWREVAADLSVQNE